MLANVAQRLCTAQCPMLCRCLHLPHSMCSAAAKHAGAGAKTEHLKALPLFRSILASLRIVDYGLFGGGGDDGDVSADAAADGAT